MTTTLSLDWKSSQRDPLVIIRALTLAEQGSRLQATTLPARIDKCCASAPARYPCERDGYCQPYGGGIRYCSAPPRTTLVRHRDGSYRLVRLEAVAAEQRHGATVCGKERCKWRAVDALNGGRILRLTDTEPAEVLSRDRRTRTIVEVYQTALEYAAHSDAAPDNVRAIAFAWLHDYWHAVDKLGIPRHDTDNPPAGHAHRILADWLAEQVEGLWSDTRMENRQEESA